MHAFITQVKYDLFHYGHKDTAVTAQIESFSFWAELFL